MNVKWTAAEKQFVRDNANRLKDREIAEVLTKQSGRQVSIHAVRKVRQNLGVKKKCGRGRCQLEETTHTIHQLANT